MVCADRGCLQLLQWGRCVLLVRRRRRFRRGCLTHSTPPARLYLSTVKTTARWSTRLTTAVPAGIRPQPVCGHRLDLPAARVVEALGAGPAAAVRVVARVAVVRAAA